MTLHERVDHSHDRILFPLPRAFTQECFETASVTGSDLDAAPPPSIIQSGETTADGESFAVL
jgi:hypothetical protein